MACEDKKRKAPPEADGDPSRLEQPLQALPPVHDLEKSEDAEFALEVFSRDLNDNAHQRMVSDTARTAAYKAAIARSVKGLTVLDLGTGPHAFLALLCAEAGARRVIALELVPEVAELARAAVRDAGFSDVVQVLVGHSMTSALPKVDVVVHEIVGNVATEEGIAATLADLQARPDVVDCSSEDWSLPACVETLAAPVSLNFAVAQEGLEPPRVARLPFALPEAVLIGSPKAIESVDTRGPIKLEQVTTQRWKVGEQATLRGFACAPCLKMGGGEVLDAWRTRTHWSQIMVRLDEAQELEVGEEVELRVTADLKRFPVRHIFEAALLRPGGEGGPCRKELGRIEVQLS